MRAIPLAGLFACLLTAANLDGQTIAGVVRTTSGGAVPGAIVSVIPAADSGPPPRVLTDENGRFAVRWRANAGFAIEVKRIGIRPYRSTAMVLSEGETKHVELSVQDVVIALGRVQVTARSACGRRAQDSREIARMLEEVRASVTVAELSAAAPIAAAPVVGYERRIDPQTGASLGDSVFSIPGSFRWPFASPDAATLATLGYATSAADGSVTFYAPDARVLASGEFVSSHCFRPVSSATDTALVGLHFSPLPNAARTDIEGTLWLDRSTAELRALDARFVRSPLSEFDDRSAITVRLARVAGGRLIVAAWSIVAPVVRLVNRKDTRIGSLRVVDEPRRELAELHESGGFVDIDDGRFSPMGSVAIEIRRDVEDERPIRVGLSGSGTVQTADSSNRVVFEHLFPGRYAVLAYISSGPARGGSAVTGSVLVRAGERAHAALGLASRTAAAAAFCPRTPRYADGGALLLVFVDSARTHLDTRASMRLFFTRTALVSADRVRTSETNFPITSAPNGWYVACDRYSAERVEVRSDDRRISPVPVGQIGRDGFEVRELVIPRARN